MQKKFQKMHLYYNLIELDGHKVPVPCDMMEVKWDQDSKRVASDYLISEGGGVITVSTVFLSINQSWEEEPVLFETMIFGGKHDLEKWRYKTWDDAIEGHKRAVALINQKQEI